MKYEYNSMPFQKHLLIALVSLFLLTAVNLHAFYAAEAGRWINRDPIGERGGINLHGFADGNPIDNFDYLGLIIEIDPSASQEFKDRLQSCLCLLQQTSRGKKLYNQAEKSPRKVILTPQPETGTSSDNLRDGGNDPIKIGLNPDSTNCIGPEAQKKYPNELPPNTLQGCAVTLGHELGHVVYDENDEDMGGKNVQKNENPIRKGLGIPLRTTCRNSLVKGAK